ncbi:DsbA family protein [Microbacterium sp. SLBN-146]|uniref:DsbA family protein n=1 Tax=Microbacterium sp. SLBN-146 TaxID=2768457 RepID=UPI00116D2AB9|nr:DsbA family protein [Microbacterium sp. SLBN-146]TQJ29727.1 thioredoxin-like protein [Microbacterium sp. SLBN-146]
MAQAQKTNWFAIWISVGVVAALVLVGALVVWMNNSANAPGPRPAGAGINSETGAIEVGSGSNELDIWFDFYCPHCQDFEREYGSTVDDLLEQGDLQVNLFPVALASLNAASGTDFSKRSANALYCVAEAEPDAAYPFMQAIFATDPTGPGLTDEELIAAASDAGATGIDACVTDREYVDFVDAQTREIPENPETGGQGTPTVVLNGDFIQLTGDPEADLVARLG